MRQSFPALLFVALIVFASAASAQPAIALQVGGFEVGRASEWSASPLGVESRLWIGTEVSIGNLVIGATTMRHAVPARFADAGAACHAWQVYIAGTCTNLFAPPEYSRKVVPAAARLTGQIQAGWTVLRSSLLSLTPRVGVFIGGAATRRTIVSGAAAKSGPARSRSSSPMTASGTRTRSSATAPRCGFEAWTMRFRLPVRWFPCASSPRSSPLMLLCPSMPLAPLRLRAAGTAALGLR